MWMCNGAMGWGGGLMMLLGSLFWIALTALVIVAVVRLWPRETFRSSMPREDEALAILRQRYARGEISKADFEEMMRDLTAPR